MRHDDFTPHAVPGLAILRRRLRRRFSAAGEFLKTTDNTTARGKVSRRWTWNTAKMRGIMFHATKAREHRLRWLLLMPVLLPASGCQLFQESPGERMPHAKTYTNSIGMKFVSLPGGTFKMGDPRRALDAFPVHDVTVSPFWIGQYEVTNEQFDLFKLRQRPTGSRTDSQPATRVYWHDAVAFCQWMSKKDGHHYRLPTNAEWEYAARGGLEQKDYPWGNASPDWRATWGSPKTTPVGSYSPNGYGLYDTAGNVEEWTQDWYSENYYAHSPELNPQGPPSGEWKITRGGSYLVWDLYVGMVSSCPVELTTYGVGFRVVMEAESTTTGGHAGK